MTDIKAALLQNAAEVEKKIISCFPTDCKDPDVNGCYEAEKYSLLAGGKRIRPFLVTEFCRSFGGDGEIALSFAAAVEMVHTFSLIHDDLPCMDDDELRRGRPTSHVMFGEAKALLAGDALSIRAFETLANSGAEPSLTVRAVRALAKAAGSDGMVGGQLTDMRGETQKLDIDTLHKLHALKTGAMIRVSAELGCIAAGIPENDERIKAADKYAAGIGLVFQIIDDILDVESTPEELGKSVGGDKEHNKTTFMTYMNRDEAFAYAKKITDEAIAAIKPYDKDGILEALAVMLLNRRK